MSDSKTLYLLDAMALAYRAHFVFISRPLINRKGQNTSAAFGFTTALLKLIEDHDIEHAAVVFDAVGEGGTFRDTLYEAYKAHRPEMPEDLALNLPFIKEVVRAFNIEVIEEPGVEADDVIGTLAQQADRDGARTVIVSPDKDFQQLLTDRISIYRPAHRGETFDPITEDSFREKFGLQPVQFIDVLALMGDASDNVPGVRGIGEKTAIQLVQEYGTVENLLEHAGDVKGKRAREGLLECREEALLSKQLVTIKTDCACELDWERLHRGGADPVMLKAILEELEFNTLIERAMRIISSGRANGSAFMRARMEEAPTVAENALRVFDASRSTYEIVRNREALREVVQQLRERRRISIDTETTSTDPMWASLVGVSLSCDCDAAWYVPTPLPDGTSTEDVLDVLRPILEDAHTEKIGHNLKYDTVVLQRHGVTLRGPIFDTMIAHYLIDPEELHNLDAVTRKYLHYRAIPISDLIGTGKNQKSMRDVPVDDAGCYACEDADITLQLADVLGPELESRNAARIAEQIEFPLTPVLAEMEMNGIRVDPVVLREIGEQLAAAMIGFEADIYRHAGGPFNIGSTQQLCEILYDKLKLPVLAKTPKGQPSTKENVLQELAIEHPLPGLILDWRQVSKLKSTYVDALGQLIHPETGRIHTSYNQTGTATGRLSSSDPNLQNIPVRTEMGREIRKAFVADEGHVLMAADYVQIELRILASMSDDEALKEAFLRGDDIHTAAAARVFGLPLDQVTRDQRRKAKEVNYGIPYGVSGWGLAQRLRMPVPEAQELIDQYQRSYPGVTRWLAMQVERARQQGYVETLLGRRRYVPDINARNRNIRSFAERVAVNMPIQGTQADMIKIAMVRIHDRLKREGLASRMLLQVHDELVFEVPHNEVDTMRALVHEEMIQALPIDVPVEVSVDTGVNWLDAH
jgi:DNA polymerase I